MKRIIERIRAIIDAPYRRQTDEALAALGRRLDAEVEAHSRTKTALRIADAIAEQVKSNEAQFIQTIGEYVSRSRNAPDKDGPFFFPGLLLGIDWIVHYSAESRAIIIRCQAGPSASRFTIARAVDRTAWERLSSEPGFSLSITREMARKIVETPPEPKRG